MRQPWGKLTADDLETIAGSQERLVGVLQERYGIAKEKALREIQGWLNHQHENPAAAGTARAAGGMVS